MSANFTTAVGAPSNSSVAPPELQCIGTLVGRYVITIISCTYALATVPLALFVLYLGVQRWRRRRSPSISHSDFFSYNMAVLELVGVFGYIFPYISSYTSLPDMSQVGILIVSFIWPAQTLLPIFICVERYLAVVHPITYRGLRRAGGVWIRNVTTGMIWLDCFVWLCLLIVVNVPADIRRATAMFVLILSLVVMLFCSLSVLRILVRPRPGKVGSSGGSRVQVDRSKQRAVLTVLVIMAVLWLKFSGNVIVILVRFLTLVGVKCIGEAFTYVFFLPNGVVLPLLFLHRAGKLPIGKHST